MRRFRVIRFRLAEILKERGWTAYRLAKESGIPQPTVYRLLSTKDGDSKISLGIIDTLCTTLGVSVSELLEHTPEGKRKRGR